MKKYSVLTLYVVKKGNHNFICENILLNEYREVLTKEKLILEENDNVEYLANYYSILAIATYKDGRISNPLMLSKKDILRKYIEINKQVESRLSQIDRISDFIKYQQEEIEGLKILGKECPELAKQRAIGSLKRTGILDEKGSVTDPYKEIFSEESYENVIRRMWDGYVESVKDTLPNIPIMSVEEANKQKKL